MIRYSGGRRGQPKPGGSSAREASSSSSGEKNLSQVGVVPLPLLQVFMTG